MVAIYSPNDLHYFSAFIGISNIRAISTCINPLYTESEVLYQLKATNAKMIVCHAICLEKVSNIIKSGGTYSTYFASVGTYICLLYSIGYEYNCTGARSNNKIYIILLYILLIKIIYNYS